MFRTNRKPALFWFEVMSFFTIVHLQLSLYIELNYVVRKNVDGENKRVGVGGANRATE